MENKHDRCGQREAARQFVNRWINKEKEDEHGHSYWIDLLSKVCLQHLLKKDKSKI